MSLQTTNNHITMKKIMFLAAALLLAGANADAQLGGLVRKAAEKAVNKATEKVVDKAADKAADAITDEVDKQLGWDKKNDSKQSKQSSKQQGNQTDEVTFLDLMTQAGELPTVQQLVNHKTAELKEQTLKLMASPVTRYMANLGMLSMQAASLAYQDLDSAQVMDAAYRYAEASTGLTRQELEALENMSEEEQQAYLMAHYNQGRAEAAAVASAEEVAKWIEPLQPLIDKWDAAGSKADKCFDDAEAQCRKIYAKYADRLASASGTARTELLIKYYGEIAPFQREAASAAMKVRLDEQMPIAEQIEGKMKKIRAEHQDAISMLLCYPQMTAASYFGDASRMLDIPEYSEGE